MILGHTAKTIIYKRISLGHFTAPFSSCLQSCIYNLVEYLQWIFFEGEAGGVGAKLMNVSKLLTNFNKKVPLQMLDWVENRLLAKGLKY